MLQPLFRQLSASQPTLFQLSSTLAIGIVLAPIPTNAATDATVERPYENFSSYSTTNPVNGDITDIYFPTLDNDSAVDDLPIVLLLQGALVDKRFYSDYASQVARYGFAVAVPNHIQSVPGFGDVLAPEPSQIPAVVEQFIAESTDPSSPLSGKVNSQKLGLLGHSLGGAVGLSSIGEICLPVFCSEPFERTEALMGSAFFGANLRDQNDTFLAIENEGVGIALIQGEQDGRALPINAERTFAQVQTPPKALITLGGVNHFGITNAPTPEGAVPDPNPQQLSQERSIETISRWSGLFLRGTVLEDQNALYYVFDVGESLDPAVIDVDAERAKEPQAASVPEPFSLIGIAGGLLSLALLDRRKS